MYKPLYKYTAYDRIPVLASVRIDRPYIPGFTRKGFGGTWDYQLKPKWKHFNNKFLRLYPEEAEIVTKAKNNLVSVYDGDKAYWKAYRKHIDIQKREAAWRAERYRRIKAAPSFLTTKKKLTFFSGGKDNAKRQLAGVAWPQDWDGEKNCRR